MIPQRGSAVKGISLKIPERKLKILIGWLIGDSMPLALY
jgi:hypothetical protein